MSKKAKFSIVSVAIACIMCLSFVIINYQQAEYTSANIATRTVELQKNELNYESILNEFENGKLETDGSLTTFEGTKTINLLDFAELNNLSATEIIEESKIEVKYNFSYDNETNIVTLSAKTINTTTNEIEIEEIYGVAFINELGEIDALLDVDGEYIYLSEMQDSGLIQNCGWFKNLFKTVAAKVVVAVVAVVAVAAVAAVVVASCGAGLGAVIAAGAIAGAVVGGVAGGLISYLETGEVEIWAIAVGVIGGAILGGLTGWAVGTIMGVGTKMTIGFGQGSFPTAEQSIANHFAKHGAEVGAKTATEYVKMAANVAQNVVKNNIAAVRAVAGVTANVFRYEIGSYYIHMAMNASEIIIVSFGLLH